MGAPKTLPANFFEKHPTAPPKTLPADFFGAASTQAVAGGANKPPTPPSLWDKANTGIISPGAIAEAVTGSPTGFTDVRDEPPSEEAQPLTMFPNPAGGVIPVSSHALRVGVAGAGQSAAETLSSFTSPVSMAMAGLGALGKAGSVLPRLAQVARGLLTAAGIGFGAQGAVQTAQAAPGAIAGNPEEAQKALLGISQVAGAAPAVATAARTVLPTRAGVQSALGIGKRMTEQATAKAEAANLEAETQTAYKNRLEMEKTELANKLADEQYEVKANEVGKKNTEALQQFRQEQAEYKADAAAVAKLNQQRRAAYEEAKQAAQQATAESKAGVAQRTQLFNDVTNNSERLATGLKDLGKQVREEGGRRFEEVAKATEGAVADPETLRSAVQYAEKNILKGSPESIKIFRNILDATEPQPLDTAETPTGRKWTSADLAAIAKSNPEAARGLMQAMAGPEGTGVGFRDLQGFYSELGQKAGAGNLPGDVYQALKYVKEQGVGKEMSRIAEERGVTDKLADARSYWRAFQQTFHDMRAVSQGGSPVARMYRAIDPDFVVRQLTGPAGTRAIAALRQYSPELAKVAAETASKARQIESLPKVAKEAPLPKEPTLKVAPKPPTEPTLKPIPAPEEGVTPKLQLPSLESVDPQALKQEAIQRMANHALSSGDWRMIYDVHATGAALVALLQGHPGYAAGMMLYPVGRRVFGLALNRPSISQWLSQPSPSELGLPETKRPPVSFRGAGVQAIGGRKEDKSGPPPRPSGAFSLPPSPLILPPAPPPIR